MNLSAPAKKMILVICLAAVAIAAIAAIYYQFAGGGIALFVPFAVGLALTSALNCVKVVMMERSMLKALENGDNVKSYMGLQYLLRFALTGVILFVAATQDFVSIWGAACGIFTLQIAALSLRFLSPDE